MNLEMIGFLKDGKYRLIVLKELNTKPQLPSELASKLGINRASLSRILKVLKDKELIISSSNNSRTIIYFISKKGKIVLEGMKDEQ